MSVLRRQVMGHRDPFTIEKGCYLLRHYMTGARRRKSDVYGCTGTPAKGEGGLVMMQVHSAH